jgi:hypothetical protein
MVLLRARRWRPTPTHVCALGLGSLFLAGFGLPLLFPFRILTLAAPVVTLLVAVALARLRPGMAAGTLAVLVIVGGTSVFAAHQYFPWTQGDAISHAIENEAPAGAMIDVLHGLAGDRLIAKANVVGSHPLLFEGALFTGLPFTNLNNVTSPGGEFFVFRVDSPDLGYSSAVSDSYSPAIIRAYTPVPTASQLALLASIHLIGVAGDYQLYRA